MDDLISRQEVIRLILERGLYCDTQADREISAEIIRQLPSAQPEKRTHERTETHSCDLIDRQAVIDAILAVTGNASVRELYEHVQEHGLSDMWSGGVNAAIDIIIAVPSAQPEERTEERTETHACDCIERQAAIDAHYEYCNKHPDAGFPVWSLKILEDLPSAQPEIIRCKDCIFHGLCRISPKWAVAPKDDWYCADAERRTDGTEQS